MLKNYFMVAIRHLKRQPGYAALNILGLTIGIASALLIVLYLNFELSFDKHQSNAENTYRISSDISEPDNSFRWTTTQVPLGRTVKDEFEEIEQYTRFVPAGNTRLQLGDQSYFAEDMFLVDSTVFDVFTFEFLQGDQNSSLDAPNSVVLSKSLADKIFKGENPIGQLLETENFSYKVTGIYEDVPKTSHIRPDAMASFSTNAGYYSSQNWGGFNIYTYVVLNENASIERVTERLNGEIMEKHVAVIFDQFDIKIKYELINIQDIHLYSTFSGEPTATGNIQYIYIFLAVAIFLVLIASINYMNLATARSMRRSLEIGIRKVMGAMRGALIRQFIVESFILSFAAVVISFVLLSLIIPLINNAVGTSLHFVNLFRVDILLIVVGIILITGLLSGSYPAFYLSAFNPLKAIKGGGGDKRTGNVWIRRVLVGIQFAVSIFMLIGTLIIYQQMNYIRTADMGFDQEQVVNFRMRGQTREKWTTLRSELLQNPNIKNASTSSTVPGRGFGKNTISVETSTGEMDVYGVDNYQVDYDYFDVLDIEVVKGRNFSREFATDTSQAVVVNEAMVERMGWDEPIGRKFQFMQDTTIVARVIGVVKNFHQRSLYDPIEALLFIPNLDNGNGLVKISGDLEEGLAHIETTWNQLFPNIPFEFEFLDQNFLEAYEEDQLRGQFFLGFAIMMIVISGLGLLGLASFSAEQRSKEISIRKVLGANEGGLVMLLVKDFIWLALIGAVPAFLVGYRIMNEWLDDFEYHIDISPVAFAIVLLLALAFVVLTTGLQAYRAATSNPSDNLKYE